MLQWDFMLAFRDCETVLCCIGFAGCGDVPIREVEEAARAEPEGLADERKGPVDSSVASELQGVDVSVSQWPHHAVVVDRPLGGPLVPVQGNMGTLLNSVIRKDQHCYTIFKHLFEKTFRRSIPSSQQWT